MCEVNNSVFYHTTFEIIVKNYYKFKTRYCREDITVSSDKENPFSKKDAKIGDRAN